MWDNSIRGNGVKTLTYLKKGEMVAEYRGESITLQQEKERVAVYSMAGEGAVGSYTFDYLYDGKWWW